MLLMENAQTEKLEIHKDIEKYQRRLLSLQSDKSIDQENKKIILNFLKDCELGKISQKPCKAARLMKYIYLLTRLNQMFGNKPFKKLNQKDIETIIIKFNNGEFKKQQVSLKIVNGKKQLIKTELNKSLDIETLDDFKGTIKKLTAYIFGNGDKYQKLAGWIKREQVIKEVPSLNREEVERLAESCNLKYKVIIMTLFDSGARIQEFLNLRIGDLTRKEDHYLIRIKHSKTKPRTISLPMCTSILDSWLSIHSDKDNPMAFLFPVGYDGLRVFLKGQGTKILKKKVNIHLFRHSSATYYCHLLNQYQLCYRYGWSMTSNQPQRYIDREGIEEQKTAELVKTDDISKFKTENQKLQEIILMLKERQDKLEESLLRRRKADQFLNEKIGTLIHE